MTHYPKISVVTITYGHENYITQTIDGVLMQDYPGEIEFIIANDNSPDATDNVIKNYFSQKKITENFFLKYTKHQVNKGIRSNFLWALEQATGKYIAFCEGDDYWIDPLKLRKQLDFLKINKEIKFCYTDFSILHNSTNVLDEDCFKKFPQRYREPRNRIDFLENTMYIGPCTWLFEKSLLEKIDFNKHHSDSSFFLILEFMKYTKLGFLDQCTVVYRDLDESASRSNSKYKQIQILSGIYKTQLSYMDEVDMDQDLRLKIEEKFFRNIVHILMTTNEDDEIEKIIHFLDEDFDLKKCIKFYITESKNRINSLANSKSYKLGLNVMTFLHKIVSVFRK